VRSTSITALASFAALTLLACGDDSTGVAVDAGQGVDAAVAPDTGAGVDTGVGGDAGADAPVPPPQGALAPGWQKAFAASSATLDCAMSFDAASKSSAPRLTIGGATLFVGYQQVSSTNQDPVVRRFDGTTASWCVRHEQQPPDARAVGVTWDGGATAYVVFTVVGGGSDLDKAASGGWLPSYGSGGGPKVAVVGQLDAATGALAHASFVIAKLASGKTNSFTPTDAPIRLASGDVELDGDSAFQPIQPDRALQICTDYPFHAKYVLAGDLATARCATSTDCTSNAPCP
jgi:hypothetical protein